jgi:hypothetical protein
MLGMRAFGKSCPECRQFVQFGKIEIQDNAPPSQLHDKLREADWQSDWVFCENPKCESKTFGELGQMILKA